MPQTRGFVSAHLGHVSETWLVGIGAEGREKPEVTLLAICTRKKFGNAWEVEVGELHSFTNAWLGPGTRQKAHLVSRFRVVCCGGNRLLGGPKRS